MCILLYESVLPNTHVAPQNSTANDAGYERRKYPTGEAAKAADDPERPRDSQACAQGGVDPCCLTRAV